MVLRLCMATLALLFVAGCGFTPMYAKSGTASKVAADAFLSTISIDYIPDRAGQYLRNQLIDRFHSQIDRDQPDYILNMSPIVENRTDLDITKSADATRARLDISTTMTLIDAKTGTPVLNRTLTSATSFNILSSQFTTRVSEDNARLNALDDIARQAEQQVMLYKNRVK